MRSTTTVTLRAIVMLACLVLIPLVAVFGKSLPELAAKLIEGVSGSTTSHSNEYGSEAPKFCPAGEPSPPIVDRTRTSSDPPNGDAAARARRLAAADQMAPGYRPESDSRGFRADMGSPTSGEVAAGYETAIDPRASGNSDPRAVRLPAALPRPENSSSRAAPRMLPPGATPSLASLATTDQNSNAGAAGGGDAASLQGGTFLMIQERLRDMGAISYRLETWGARGQLYRFQCEMSVTGGSPNLTRHFEATDGHPLLAMHKVLVEAEAWRASQ